MPASLRYSLVGDTLWLEDVYLQVVSMNNMHVVLKWLSSVIHLHPTIAISARGSGAAPLLHTSVGIGVLGA